uniref:Uncharacterized protein n=1 Tax=Rhizophora mucronata TaxID=61149 RepID=A0A2P2PLF9_RHIMU
MTRNLISTIKLKPLSYDAQRDYKVAEVLVFYQCGIYTPNNYDLQLDN